MRTVSLIAGLLATVWLQVGLLGGARPLGVVPNLLLVVVIYVGLLGSATETLGLALGGGLLLDLVSGADFGLRMAFYAVLALAVMVAAQSGLDLDNVGLLLGITAAGTIGYNLSVLASLITAHVHLPLELVATRIGIETVLNCLLLVILRPLLIRWLRRPSNQLEVSRNG